MCGEHRTRKGNYSIKAWRGFTETKSSRSRALKGIGTIKKNLKKNQKYFHYHGVTILRKENILIVQNIPTEKLCKAAHEANSSRKVEEAVLPNVLRSLSG